VVKKKRQRFHNNSGRAHVKDVAAINNIRECRKRTAHALNKKKKKITENRQYQEKARWAVLKGA